MLLCRCHFGAFYRLRVISEALAINNAVEEEGETPSNDDGSGGFGLLEKGLVVILGR